MVLDNHYLFLKTQKCVSFLVWSNNNDSSAFRLRTILTSNWFLFFSVISHYCLLTSLILIFFFLYVTDNTRRELKDMMLENVRNSSSQDGQKKCEIFESELRNAQQCLKSPVCRQISALPTPPKLNENSTPSKTFSSSQQEKESNEVSF